MKRAAIRPSGFAHVGDEKGTKHAGKSPRRQHQTVNGPDILRPKVISCKCRHRAESAAVTHQHHKGNDRFQRGCYDVWEEPEQQSLANKYHEECSSSGDQIGNPRPEDSPDGVADTRQSYHACGNYRTYYGL